MIPKGTILANIGNCINDTAFLNLPNHKAGKVRDQFDLGDRLLLVTTDRQSAFDRVLAQIPFKGQVLNQVSAWWFEQTKDIVKNHVISIPDPNATLAQKCKVFPIEFVMRGYLTGSTSTSAWTQYKYGKRNICGNILPGGMVKNQKFAQNILTPTTKDDEHDENISAREIVEKGIIPAEKWEKLSKIAFALFERGQEIAARHGLILVDTKYELGENADGEIILIDEIHTPDSSRYWLADSYEENFSQGKDPENIDKEFLRLWFKDHCDPYNDKVLPKAPDDLVAELSRRYILLYETITGKEFSIDVSQSVLERLKKNLTEI